VIQIQITSSIHSSKVEKKQFYFSGVACITEGDTERIFYERLLYHYYGNHPEYAHMDNQCNDKTNDITSFSTSETHSEIIRMNHVGTITQLTHSDYWFKNTCKKLYPDIKWTVFLCYDTD